MMKMFGEAEILRRISELANRDERLRQLNPGDVKRD
jgi:hypothetical protein